MVACLLPANADEANLAATYVAANARAMHCLRLAHDHSNDTTLILKCAAQAASMMRQARATRSLLLRVQDERRKREADNAANDKAAWIEHCAIGLMAQALTDAPHAAPAPDPVPTEAQPAAAQADIAAEADQYALRHRKRAVLIRALGHLPDKLDFGPLSPELVATIVSGTSQILMSLDKDIHQPGLVAA